MKNIKKFTPWEEGSECGWYYNSYYPETGEGEGWFGTPEEVAYYFRHEMRFDPEWGEERLMSQTCGVGKGCFWTAWQ